MGNYTSSVIVKLMFRSTLGQFQLHFIMHETSKQALEQAWK